MSILITGAGGYVGQELLIALLRSTPFETTITITDVKAPEIPAAAGENASRVRSIAADLTSPAAVEELIIPEQAFESVYVLHGIMSSGSEANFELGLRVNVDATRYIFDRLRTTMPGVKVVYTSSLAVYGPTPKGFVINESNLVPAPSSSYGSQKLIMEILLNDYTRKGYLDGRALRLPTVTVRAGQPTQAASSFASDIIREPFHGKKAILPVDKETEIWICSPYTVIRNLLHARTIPGAAFGESRSVNLPGLKVTVQEMLQALERVGGPDRRAVVEEKQDPDVIKIVDSWSPNFDTNRAKELGFADDISMLENIQHFASTVHQN